MYLESSALLAYFLWWESLLLLLKPSLNVVSAIQKKVLSGVLVADTTALYTRFAVKLLL